ncbi:MAG: nitrogenase component 1 [Eubacteriaceae bacterium]|jgi:nitrogenase molybdenum-iron protein beta chain
MAKLLDKQRYKCAMGAMQTVQAVSRAIPILHSGPGCAQKLSDNTGSSGYFSPNIFPCTSINEKDVVFGGTKKLHSTIENALKVIDADLYVVLTGCIPEIVGDDTGEVVSEFADADKPVIYASTAGFKGNNYKGHEQIIDAITDQYLKKSDHRQKGLVNIWADVPYQDLFWLGNLRELEKLVQELGLTPNTIFGFDRGIDNINRIPEAQFNLLVSPWVSVRNMKNMEKKLDIPFLHYPTLPIGAFETGKFLRTVGRFAGVSDEKIESVINSHENYYYYLIERYADLFLENRVINKQFSVVADVRFETDGYQIQNQIREHDYHGYPLILGSYYEKELTEDLKGNYLNISWPVQDKVVLDNHYAGYSGGIRLIEDIYSVAVQRWN